MKAPEWKPMTPDIEPIDGREYLLAFWVRTQGAFEHWEINKVQAISYDDGTTLYQGDDHFDAWEFHDSDFYILIDEQHDYSSEILGDLT